MGKKTRIGDMGWDDYGITKQHKKELVAFCLRYPEMRKQIRQARKPESKGKEADMGPKTPQADQNARKQQTLQKDMLMIDQTLYEANPEIYKYLKKSVTEGSRYMELGMVPINEKDFYGYKRYFYYLLSLKR